MAREAAMQLTRRWPLERQQPYGMPHLSLSCRHQCCRTLSARLCAPRGTACAWRQPPGPRDPARARSRRAGARSPTCRRPSCARRRSPRSRSPASARRRKSLCRWEPLVLRWRPKSSPHSFTSKRPLACPRRCPGASRRSPQASAAASGAWSFQPSCRPWWSACRSCSSLSSKGCSSRWSRGCSSSPRTRGCTRRASRGCRSRSSQGSSSRASSGWKCRLRKAGRSWTRPASS
mmetsp:Transcript_39942/g.114130  ORF Transcript_39942/g.114130 Transcript_39942/m.114130 type:complete len:233 (-) Transcript_39942:851-1549(-)